MPGLRRHWEGEMTLADLQEHVWRRMPLRKHIAGRQAVDDITALIVENWQGEYMGAAADDAERAVVSRAIAAAVKRSHQWQSGKDANEYGFFWALILQAVVSAAIQLVLKWWLERRSHRAMLTVWQHELTA